MATGTRIDPDEALWDKARGMLADELGELPSQVGETDRHYIEQHAPAYAAMLIREDEDLEAMYDEAHQRLLAAFTGTLPPLVLDPLHYLVTLAAPIVVHAALEARRPDLLAALVEMKAEEEGWLGECRGCMPDDLADPGPFVRADAAITRATNQTT
jgi:hypothetical protein